MTFDRPTHLCVNKHPNKDVHFHHSKKFARAMLQSVPLKKHILFYHSRLFLSVLKCHLNEVIWYILFFV